MSVAVHSIVLALVGAGLMGTALMSGCKPDTEPVERGTATLLQTIARELPVDDMDKAKQALAQDAWRREHRFLDAVEPGHLFASTRVDQAEIDHHLWSSDELYQLGGQLFTHQFTRAEGFGGAEPLGLRRFHDGRRGGPDGFGCTSCHWRGGLAGAGDAADNAMFGGDGVHQSSTVARNPPALAGAGLRERLAQQMNTELALARDQALARAAAEGHAVRVPLQAKDVRFGYLTARADGTLDATEVAGVDSDLVIKPFGWKGTFGSIREAAEDALLVHHGMQTTTLVDEGDPARVGARGGADPDGDGIAEEIREGQLSALVLFVAMQELPAEEIPNLDPYLATLWARGRLDFETLGCASCHVPALMLDDAVYTLEHRDGGPDFAVDLSIDGAAPRLERGAQDDGFELRLYSDLKRHRMGAALAESRNELGANADEFITPPLWGIARSRPYLHDGRAPTLDDAILLHGGEAQASRDAFASLDDAGRGPLRVFLTSLVRATRLVTP